MVCRGKALQWAPLLLALLVLATPALSAAVHRAHGVDAATARLLGDQEQPVVSHVAVEPSSSSDPAAFFAPDAWRPVWRDLSALRSTGSRRNGSQEAPMGPRQLWPRKRSDEEVVITPRPAQSTTPTITEFSKEKVQQRSPEVQDSIAAVANQLLASGPDMPVLDVRTPPRMKQQQQQLNEASSSPPSKDKEESAWSLVSTNNAPQRITTVDFVEKPITKVPQISSLTSTTPKITTEKHHIAISTRFPPRKPAAPVTTESNISTKKPLVVEITKKPITETPSSKKPVVEITTRRFVTESPVTKKPEVINAGTKKPEIISTASTTTKKPTTVALKKTPTPISITILKRADTQIDEITSTTRRPVVSITERIPTTFSKLPELSKPSKVSEPPKASKIVETPKPSQVSALPTPSKLQSEIITTEIPSLEELTTILPVETTTKQTRRPTKKKKNKNRRRRPATSTTEKPDDILETKEGSEENLLIKPNKPLSTRIYQFISRDVMPNFGMGIMGVLLTAGLAGLLLLPIDGFTRRADVNKREEESEGILPSIIQAVMTSLNIGEQKYAEEQGPRRFKRQNDEYYNEIASNNDDVSSSTDVDTVPSRPFSFVRLMKQVLAIKLDIVSSMLRVASEALRNYAQHGGGHVRPQVSEPTTSEPPSTAEEGEGAATDEATMEEVLTVKYNSPHLPSQNTPVSIETTTELIIDEDNEESNLVRRRTNL